MFFKSGLGTFFRFVWGTFLEFISRRTARKLAIEVEALACQLALVPVVSSQPTHVSVVRTLQTTRDLLTSLLTQQEKASLHDECRVEEVASIQPATPPKAPDQQIAHTTIDTDKVDSLPQSQDEAGEAADLDKITETSPGAQSSNTECMEYTVLPEPLLNSHPALSATARALIGLGDWILLTNAGRTSVSHEMVTEICRQVIQVLAKEGVTPIQNDGLCDYDHQKVVGTRHTDDPTMIDYVCSTIRPGYIFREQLLRPQEVIVYVD